MTPLSSKPDTLTLPEPVLHGIDERCLPYMFRYLAAAPAFPPEVLEDDLCDALIGNIRWPKGAQRVVQVELKSSRRANVDDEEDGPAGDRPADPVDAAMAVHHSGFAGSLRVLGKRQPQWLRGVFAHSLKALSSAPPLQVRNPLNQLKPIFGWNAVDVAVAELTWLASRNEQFSQWLDNLPGVGRDACAAYARVLGIDRHLLRVSLAANGPLARSGLLIFQRRRLGFRDPPQLNTNLLLALDDPEFSASRLAERLLPACPDPALGVADFAHLAEDVEALTRMLREASERRAKGVNVLIYGPPGTGKTQLARLLIHRSLLKGYEIPTTDTEEDADQVDDSPVGSRLGVVRSAQRLLGQADEAVLLFDESEDAFPVRSAAHLGEGALGQKAWINEILENCPVPMLWVGNAVHHMDPAFLRRFTYHLEVPRPPRAVRRRMTALRAEREGLPAAVAAPLAEYADASPALIDTALRFASLASGDAADDTGNERLVGLALRGLRASLSVCGLNSEPAMRLSSTRFDPGYINLRPNLRIDELVSSLGEFRQANLCLYGVPGTGKTSLAEFIAERLERPLQAYRASDLQSKWVGDCEKNIRAMFTSASREGAVLLLDEADAFLYDRRSAREPWQRSQVNELLQAMERFDGVFIAATNLIDTIDPAALRRFTYKLEFLPLTARQGADLFVSSWPGTLGDEDRAEISRGVQRLEGVTPGDIAVVARQNQLRRQPMQVSAGLELLQSEVALRSGRNPLRIGFAA